MGEHRRRVGENKKGWKKRKGLESSITWRQLLPGGGKSLRPKKEKGDL